MKLLIILLFVVALTPVTVAQPAINPIPTKLDCPSPVKSVAFSPDGKRLAAGCRGLVRIWSTADLKVISDLAFVEAPFIPEVEFSPDGKLIAAANEDGEVRVWTNGAANSVRTIIRKGDRPKSLRFSRDSKQLAFASEEKVIVCDLKSDKCTTLVTDTNSFHGFVSAAFSPTSDALFIFRGNAVEHWDPINRKRVKAWKTSGHEGFFGDISPNGKLLITGGGGMFGHKVVEIWNTSGIKVGEVSRFRGGLFGVAISHSKELFAVAGGNYGYEPQGSKFSVWSLKNPVVPGVVSSSPITQDFKPLGVNTPQEVGFVSFSEGPLRNLEFSPDDKTLAVPDGDRSVLLYDVDRIRGPRIEKRDYALCGEIIEGDEITYIRPLSKVPSAQRNRFEYYWGWEILNPALVKNLHGAPVILTDWEYEISAGRAKIRINQSLPLLTSEAKRSLDHITFGEVKHSGSNDDGSVVAKIYQDGTFAVVDDYGKCVSYGHLDQRNNDFKTLRTRLVNQGLLSIPTDPLGPSANHFRMLFIELKVNGATEMRSDEDGWQIESAKRDNFRKIYEQERPFINTLRNAGLMRASK